ncbi:MAG: 3-oxoacyl-ACP reductase FabG [Gammaproteobacteria bacterium]|nr:3-oxoacyl-ACP reductase FabG [Gammaproteobacteria bacterium]
MTTELNDEIVLVTGASRGIGKAIADTLGAAGATVIGTATSESGAQQISERFKSLNIRGQGMALNVTDAEQMETMLAAIADQFGAVSVLVNNAGITRDNLMLRMKENEWDDVIATNLSAVWRLCKLVMKPMIKARSGRIINIASVVGHTGNAGQVNYAAAKAGMTGLTKALARELGGRGITVNAIAPGFIESDMTDALSEEHKKKLADEIALGRLGAPEDVAEGVLFLASDKAGYITGHTLHINGGMYM